MNRESCNLLGLPMTRFIGITFLFGTGLSVTSCEPFYQQELLPGLGIDNSKLHDRSIWFHNRHVLSNQCNNIHVDGHSTCRIVISWDQQDLFSREIGNLHLDEIVLHWLLRHNCKRVENKMGEKYVLVYNHFGRIDQLNMDGLSKVALPCNFSCPMLIEKSDCTSTETTASQEH